jgi:hypothetical protein
MITIRAILTNNLNFTSISAESLNQYSNAKLVVYLPALASGTVLYSWITPANLKIGERILARDAAEDSEDYEGLFAYSSQIYPGMTLGLTAQQDTGVALFRVRIGNILSPIAKLTVLKSLTPEDTEMPPTQFELLEELIEAIQEQLAEEFVKVDIAAEYDEITDLDQQDAIYVEREGVGKFITANNMLGGIEANINTLNFEASVGTTIAEPTWARTWYDPIEQIEGNTVVENEPTVLEQMNFTDESPEVNLMAASLDETVNTNEQTISISNTEVLMAFAEVEPVVEQTVSETEGEEVVADFATAEPEQEQTVGTSESEVNNSNVEGETELTPGVSETEYNPYG